METLVKPPVIDQRTEQLTAIYYTNLDLTKPTPLL